MITKDNLKFCFDSLTKKEVNKAINANKDFILFEIHTFNIGSYATIKAKDYKKKHQKYAENNGQVFCDKDNFLQLFVESGSTNKHLLKHL